MSDSNKQLVRRLYQEIVNEGNDSLIDELVGEGYVHHSREGTRHGRQALRDQISTYLGAFPDMKLQVDDVLSDGDRVATRVTGSGTHTGPLEGMPPTGKPVKIDAQSIFRIEGGQVVEEWEIIDEVSMMEQLGQTPS